MIHNKDNSEENYIPEQRNYALTTLRLYSQLGIYLSKEDAAAVVEAHQVLFPHSSPTGVERVISLAQKLLPKEQVGFHNIDEYYASVRSETIRIMIEQKRGYAILLAGAVEHAAHDVAKMAHQSFTVRDTEAS